MGLERGLSLEVGCPADVFMLRQLGRLRKGDGDQGAGIFSELSHIGITDFVSL